MVAVIKGVGPARCFKVGYCVESNYASSVFFLTLRRESLNKQDLIQLFVAVGRGQRTFAGNIVLVHKHDLDARKKLNFCQPTLELST